MCVLWSEWQRDHAVSAHGMNEAHIWKRHLDMGMIMSGHPVYA